MDFDAEQYSRSSRIQKEWGSALLEDLRLAGYERVLDIGCGDGALTEQLALRVPGGSVLGIDSSESMIALAEKRKAPNLQFRRQDACEARSYEEFDVCFSNAALHWVKNHRLLLKVVWCALRPGGIARFSFGGEGNCPTFQAVLRETMAAPEFAGATANFTWPWVMYSATDYQAMLAEARFSEPRAWIENSDKYFNSPAELADWIDQPCIVPFVAHLGEELGRRFRDAVVEETVRRTLQPDGRCLERYRRLNVRARK